MHTVSIVEAKRDLSRLVNTAAFGRTAIVLTSRGRPKAVLVGHEEFLKLSGGKPQKFIQLGGSWKGTPEVSPQLLRRVRAEVWARLTRR